MKVRGSSWKFALILFTAIIITAQLLFLIHWRWRFWQHQWRKENESPPAHTTDWMVVEVPSSEQQQIYMPSEEDKEAMTEDGEGKGNVGVQEAGYHQRETAVPKPTQNGNDGKNTSELDPIVQETICPRKEVTGGCYVIMDGPDVSGRGFSRFLRIESRGESTTAEVALDFPVEYNFTKENSRHWPLLTNHLQMDYQRLAVSQPFITQTFTSNVPATDKAAVKHILCLGLHASAVNNYFANLSKNKYDVTVVEPEQSLRLLVEKWFGFKEAANHRIFVENPAFYVTARARLIENPKANEKMPTRVDFILVDMCTGFDSKLPGKCPTSEFEDEQNVLALSKNLANNGTIVVHFFSPDNNASSEEMSLPSSMVQQQNRRRQLANHEHQILQLFQKHFKNCFFVSIASHLLLTCTPSAPLTRAKYLTAFRALPKELQMFDANQEPKFFLDIEALKR